MKYYRNKKGFVNPLVQIKHMSATNKDKCHLLNYQHNYLTSDELHKFASVDVSNDSTLAECQALFLEQVFSSSHDEDMVPSFAINAYHHSIGKILLRTGIVSNLMLIMPLLADLGFRTSEKVISEIRFKDTEIPNAV